MFVFGKSLKFYGFYLIFTSLKSRIILQILDYVCTKFALVLASSLRVTKWSHILFMLVKSQAAQKVRCFYVDIAAYRNIVCIHLQVVNNKAGEIDIYLASN